MPAITLGPNSTLSISSDGIAPPNKTVSNPSASQNSQTYLHSLSIPGQTHPPTSGVQKAFNQHNQTETPGTMPFPIPAQPSYKIIAQQSAPQFNKTNASPIINLSHLAPTITSSHLAPNPNNQCLAQKHLPSVFLQTTFQARVKQLTSSSSPFFLEIS